MDISAAWKKNELQIALRMAVPPESRYAIMLNAGIRAEDCLTVNVHQSAQETADDFFEMLCQQRRKGFYPDFMAIFDKILEAPVPEVFKGSLR